MAYGLGNSRQNGRKIPGGQKRYKIANNYPPKEITYYRPAEDEGRSISPDCFGAATLFLSAFGGPISSPSPLTLGDKEG